MVALVVLLCTLIGGGCYTYSRFSVIEDHTAANVESIQRLQQAQIETHDTLIEVRDDVKFLRAAQDKKSR